jgi:hypothetical protein
MQINSRYSVHYILALSRLQNNMRKGTTRYSVPRASSDTFATMNSRLRERRNSMAVLYILLITCQKSVNGGANTTMFALTVVQVIAVSRPILTTDQVDVVGQRKDDFSATFRANVGGTISN